MAMRKLPSHTSQRPSSKMQARSSHAHRARSSSRKAGTGQLKKSHPHKFGATDRRTDEEYETKQSTLHKCTCERCRIFYADKDRQQKKQIELLSKLAEAHACIKHQMDSAITDLDHLVSFKSISVDLKQRKAGCLALEWVENRLADLKFRTNLYPLDNDPHSCIVEPQQEVLFASYFSSAEKCTVMVYAHIDVVPAMEECWFGDPFQLNAKEGLIYGRGVTSGKGMLVGWLQAIECWLKVLGDLPINVKFVVDMLHEVGSEGLPAYVLTRNDFFVDVDYMIFDVNSWLNSEHPVISCGLTGWAHYGVEVRGANKSLEAGLAGGLVFEPMTDVCHLMNSLVNNQHEIQIPRIDHMVRRLTVQDWHLLETADFNAYKYQDQLEIRRLRHGGNKVDLLQHRWCKPALTMHGFQGDDPKSQYSRTLPMLVMGKFSLRLVPDQELEHTDKMVREYLKSMSNELQMGTEMHVYLLDSCEPSSWSMTSPWTAALSRAVGDVFQKDPVTTAGIPICLPIASVFKMLLKKPVLLVPYSQRVDHRIVENESIQEELFMRHSKVCVSLLFELSTLAVKCKCGKILEYCTIRGSTDGLAKQLKVAKTPKRNLLAGLLRVDSTRPAKPKKKVRNYLCMGFPCKHLFKKKRSSREDVGGKD